MKSIFLLTASLLSIHIFCSEKVLANVGEAYGFGSKMTALAGAGAAWGSGPYAAYHNPATLGAESDKRLQMAFGLVYAQPNFIPIQNIITQNKFNSDSDVYSNVDVTYRPTLGEAIGISFKLFPDVTLGATAFVPISQFAFMDSGEALVPEYVLYRARTQRPQVETALGIDLGKGLRAGAGLHMGFTLTSTASLFINTRANTASSIRFTSSLQPSLSPYFGLMYSPKENPQSLSFGAVYRMPLASNNTMNLNSAARVFGDFAAIDFNLQANSALFYDPASIELGTSFELFSGMQIFGQLDYQMWGRYQVPALKINQTEPTTCSASSGTPCDTVTIAQGWTPSGLAFRNILVPRGGTEIAINDSSVFRFGYAYKPSFLNGLPTGSGNYLDPSKHMINLGFGFRSQEFLGYEIANQLDLNLIYHYLIHQHITKTPGNEAGDATDFKIGAPGYDMGGAVYGAGISLAFEI